MTDLIIIGAGTAGLTAAIYGARAGLSVEVIEKTIYGGQIIATSSIENYPGMPGVSGVDFVTALYRQAEEFGAEIRYETIQTVSLSGADKQIVTTKEAHSGRAVIIATGAKPKKLGVPGEETWIGRGVAFCATCDGALYRGKDVAVVGGGNVAIGDALLLSGLCRTVTVIHRSSVFQSEQMQLEQAQRKENVRFLTNTAVKEIDGGNVLEKLVIENSLNGQRMDLPVDGVFVAIGAEPDNAIFAHEVGLDQAGYVIAGEDCRTNLPGVFAAGDTRTKQVRQVVTAAADGSVAALAAKEYLDAQKH